jgi:hypothetical protein
MDHIWVWRHRGLTKDVCGFPQSLLYCKLGCRHIHSFIHIRNNIAVSSTRTLNCSVAPHSAILRSAGGPAPPKGGTLMTVAVLLIMRRLYELQRGVKQPEVCAVRSAGAKLNW